MEQDVDREDLLKADEERLETVRGLKNKMRVSRERLGAEAGEGAF